MSLLTASRAPAQERTVDFRFAPRGGFSLVCFPSDWQKSTVTTLGALGYDFGPGPYARPLSEISVWTDDDTLLSARQSLDDPRVPIVRTVFTGKRIQAAQKIFAILPRGAGHSSVPQQSGRVRRVGGFTGCVGWASPPGGTDPAFRNAAWGTNRPILYRVRIEPRGTRLVALGILEPYKQRPASRILELKVEGAPTLTVDPLEHGVRNQPQVFFFSARDTSADGWLTIETHAAPTSSDPNVFLNAFWLFPDTASVKAEDLIRGIASARAELAFHCGTELEEWAPAPRTDALRTLFFSAPGTPSVRVRTRRALSYDSSGGILRYGGKPHILVRPRPVAARGGEGTWELILPRGTRSVDVAVVHGGRSPEAKMPDLDREESRAREFWLGFARTHPLGIEVPDSGIQFLLEASLRNIYQAADVVDGKMQFQPGPTVYRGLWVGDQILTAIPLLATGRRADVETFIDGTLRYQLPTGQIRVMVPTLSLVETPMVMYTMWRYARTTDSRRWLEKRWSAFAKGMEWIATTRAGTLRDSTTVFAGLMPPGFVDGGVSVPMPDYGSVWWAMIALEKGVDAARWLGRERDAAAWGEVTAGFLSSVGRRMKLDIRADALGNRYLPIGVGDTSSALPQRGQYAFLLPLPHGDFFTRPDSVMGAAIRGTLAMLDAHTEEGLILNSGWLKDGVWPWLGGIHSVAHNAFGSKEKALDILYSFANHASPAGVWVEEQMTREIGDGTAGDAADAEASAVFIGNVLSFLLREHGGGLTLLPNLPADWCGPGGTITLTTSTLFGQVRCRLEFSKDGKNASLRLSSLDGHGSPGIPAVCLEGLRRRGFSFSDGSPLPDLYRWQWRKGLRLDFVRDAPGL